MTTARYKTAIERGSGNVYADLGLKRAESLRIKAALVAAIADIINFRRLTEAAAAEVVGLTQPKLLKVLRGEFQGVSEGRLIHALTRLGRDVDIVITKCPSSRSLGRLSVLLNC